MKLNQFFNNMNHTAGALKLVSLYQKECESEMFPLDMSLELAQKTDTIIPIIWEKLSQGVNFEPNVNRNYWQSCPICMEISVEIVKLYLKSKQQPTKEEIELLVFNISTA